MQRATVRIAMDLLLAIINAVHGAGACFGRTSSLCAIWLDLETTLVNQIERFQGVPTVYDAGNIDLVGALADHLNIHIALREGCEHATCDTDHVAHLPPNKRQDGHVAVYGDLRKSASRQERT